MRGGYALLICLLILNVLVTCASWWTLREALQTTRVARQLLQDLADLKQAALKIKEPFMVQDGVIRNLYDKFITLKSPSRDL